MITELNTFVEFFQALGYGVRKYEDFNDGIAIALFLSSLDQAEIQQLHITTDRTLQNCSQLNMALILRNLHTYNHNILKNSQFQLNLQITDVCKQQNQLYLLLILRECFVLSTKAKNSRLYIETVLTLSQQSQVILADLLTYTSSTPNRQDSFQRQSNQSSSHKITDFSCQKELIQKCHELEQQNDRLYTNLKELSNQFQTLQENNHTLTTQLQQKCKENSTLKDILFQYQKVLAESNENTQNKELENRLNVSNYTNQQDNNVDAKISKLERIIKQLKQKIQMGVIQKETLKNKYLFKIGEYEQLIRIQRIQGERREEMIQNQKNAMLEKYEEYQQYFQKYKDLKQKNDLLQQSQAMLKFQLSYKNTQIQDLKQMIMNNSTRKDEEENFINAPYKILKNQFHSLLSTPANNVHYQQTKKLKIEIKELEKQIENLKQVKTKNKQLIYENRKMRGILNEFKMSRGEENYILTGCLYEMYLRNEKKQLLVTEHSEDNN